MISVLILARLFSMATLPLMDTSEPRYAEIARVMAASGDWITPWFEPGTPFWGKPPLSFWAQAFSIKSLGLTEFSIRLPSFLVTVALTILVYHAGIVIGDKRMAKWATLILSTMLLPMVSAGAVLTDPFFAFGVTLSMLAFVVAPLKPTWFWRYGFFVGIALGLLSKGPLAVVLVAIAIVPWLALQPDRRTRINVFPWLSGLFLIFALSLPWYIAAEIKTPGFLQYFIVGEHFLRFLDGGWNGDLYGTAHEKPLGRIWIEWLFASLPWGPLGLAVLLWSMIRSRRRTKLACFVKKPVVTFLIFWTLAAMVFFTFSANILWTYVLPSLPALALLLAQAATATCCVSTSRRTSYALIAAGSLVPAFSIAVGAIALVAPAQLKTEKELVMAAAQDLEAGKKLYFVGSRPFSARFYSRGQAELIPSSRLGSLLEAGQSALIAMPRSQAFDALRMSASSLKLIFQSKRYSLYDLTPMPEKHAQ
ncbi:glycosyltransferase family 39 protein [Pusillimonas caeni]|nr:glycosyltransferase family 39 protein [Pusillimonas caeni]